MKVQGDVIIKQAVLSAPPDHSCISLDLNIFGQVVQDPLDIPTRYN